MSSTSATATSAKRTGDRVDPKKMTRILENSRGLTEILKPYINLNNTPKAKKNYFGRTHALDYIYEGVKTPFIPSAVYSAEDLENILLLLVTIKSLGEHIKIAHVSIGPSADLEEDRGAALAALVTRVNTDRTGKEVKNPIAYEQLNLLKVPFLLSVREKGVTDKENVVPQVLDLMTVQKHEICIAQHQWIPVELELINKMADQIRKRALNPTEGLSAEGVVASLRIAVADVSVVSDPPVPVVAQSAAAGGGA